jgi:hypothetical protein
MTFELRLVTDGYFRVHFSVGMIGARLWKNGQNPELQPTSRCGFGEWM